MTSRFRRGARIASTVVIGLGVMVCLGWLLELPALTRLHPGLVAMKLNTALTLTMMGGALRLALDGRHRASRGVALAAIAIPAATLIEYGFDIDLAIDQLICRDPAATTAPGRMAPVTAGSLVALGIALAWLEARWSELVALAGALVAHVALLGYLYGAPALYAIGPFVSIALHTAVGLYVLALGILMAHPERGLMRVATGESPGGVFARRLLPAAVVLPAVLGLLRQWGEQAGYYGTGTGRALLVASTSTLFVALAWWTAAALTRADRQRWDAESGVREREADLAITLESIGDGVIATDDTGRITRMNGVAERLTGWSAEAARGRALPDVFRIVDEDTGKPVESPADRVLRDGVTVGQANHTALVARDGTSRAIGHSGAPIRSAHGDRRGVVLVFQDQSDARAAERRLRYSEARKAAILESALDAIVTMDATGTIVDFNPAAEAMFGRSRAAVVGTSLASALIPPALRDGHSRGLARYIASRESRVLGNRLELTAVRSDNREFPVELSISRIGCDEPPTFTGFIRDVSAAHQARAELVRSNNRLRVLAEVSDAYAQVATSYQVLLDRVARTIADLIGDGCIMTLLSSDGEHLLTVACGHRDPDIDQVLRSGLVGFAIAKASGSSLSATVARTGEPRRGDIAPEAMVAQAEEPLRPVVTRLNVHSFAVVAIRVRGTMIGTLALVRSEPDRSYSDDDVTLLQDLADRAGLAIDNARLYEQLEDRVRERTKELEIANRELEAFSYSVAHDLRSPLRGIAGFSRTMLEDFGAQLGPEGAKYLARIEAGAQRMGHLIDDLLDLSRVSRTELSRRPIDLSEMVRAVGSRLAQAEPARAVELAIATGLTTSADPRLVDIVLTNLLDNAWKFTAKHSDARIEFGARPGRPATYFVRDNGAGFDPRYASKLFGVFERLHPATEFEGTGIGLAIAQRIIDRHGGRIWAEGEVGAGATFFFTLEPRSRRDTQQ